MLYGVIVNHYEPFESETDRQRASRERHYAPFEDTDRWVGSLSDATDDLVRQLLRSNSYLSAATGSARQEQIDGASSYSVVLSGRSPVTGQEERVTVVTRGLPDGHVLYALGIVPRQRLRLDGADLHAHAADAESQRRRGPPRNRDQRGARASGLQRNTSHPERRGARYEPRRDGRRRRDGESRRPRSTRCDAIPPGSDSCFPRPGLPRRLHRDVRHEIDVEEHVARESENEADSQPVLSGRSAADRDPAPVPADRLCSCWPSSTPCGWRGACSCRWCWPSSSASS